METTLYEVKFYDGRMFRVFCKGKAKKLRFYNYIVEHKTEIKNFKCITNGIHTISEFEKITTNKL